MLPIQRLLGVAGLIGSASIMSGCYAAVEPGPVYSTSAVVAADGYEPAYYDGYVVYYDNVGRPYYYTGGAVMWVPASSPYYIGLTNHWHTYGSRYRGWYAHEGYRYRGYRAPAGHASYHTSYHASATHRGAVHGSAHRSGGHHR